MDTKKDLESNKQKYAEAKTENPKQGINDWNDRLDQNLETKDHNDVTADQKANDFSKKYGSGDQSDDQSK